MKPQGWGAQGRVAPGPATPCGRRGLLPRAGSLRGGEVRVAPAACRPGTWPRWQRARTREDRVAPA